MLTKLQRARAGSLATFGALALAAALVDLGRFHRLEHGDSLVPVLVSLQRWTFFYWDQERYGMLVPLLALPVRDPLANLLLQRFLLVLAGLATVVLLARHALAGRDWRLAGALAAGLVLLSWPAPWAFEYLGDQPYGLSLALALAGLAVAEPTGGERAGRARLGAGLALVVLAHWVNAATALLLLPLAVARTVVDRHEGAGREEVRRRLLLEAGLLLAGLAAGQAMLRLWPVVTGNPLRLHVAPLPIGEWPGAWGALLGRAWREAGPLPAALGATAASGLALLLLPAFRPLLRPALLRAAALVLTALGYALLTGTVAWVRENAYHWRYLAPSAVLCEVAAASLLAEPLSRAVRLARPALAAAVALLPALALVAAGPPSPGGVRADLDRVAGARTEDVLAAGCELVTGDYWSVWPTVFHAALVAAERGEPARLRGLCHRSNPTVPDWWERREGIRICAARGAEAESERWLRTYHLWPVRLLERWATVDVVTPAGSRP